VTLNIYVVNKWGAFKPSAYRGQHASPVQQQQLPAAGWLGSALFTLRCRPKYVYNFNLRDVGHKLRPVDDRTAWQNFDPQPSEFCLTASYSDGVLNPSFRQPYVLIVVFLIRHSK